MNATYDELVEMLRIDREKIEELDGFLKAEREHADALKSVIQDIVNAWSYGDLGINEHCEDHVRIPMARYKSVDAAIHLSPRTSLTQRDARVVADELRQLGKQWGKYINAGDLYRRADKLLAKADEIAAGGVL